VSDSIVESLSTIGLVAGFPLLLLCFMLSLEKLESWGLRELDHSPEQSRADRIEAAMDAVERLATNPARSDGEPVDGTVPVAAHHASGAPDGRAVGP
jgi:hypothetical protein